MLSKFAAAMYAFGALLGLLAVALAAAAAHAIADIAPTGAQAAERAPTTVAPPRA